MIPLLVALTVVAHTEALIILSNVLLTIATLLVFWASMREQHATVRQLVRMDNKLTRFIVKTFTGKVPPSDPH